MFDVCSVNVLITIYKCIDWRLGTVRSAITYSLYLEDMLYVILLNGGVYVFIFHVNLTYVMLQFLTVFVGGGWWFS